MVFSAAVHVSRGAIPSAPTAAVWAHSSFREATNASLLIPTTAAIDMGSCLIRRKARCFSPHPQRRRSLPRDGRLLRWPGGAFPRKGLMGWRRPLVRKHSMPGGEPRRMQGLGDPVGVRHRDGESCACHRQRGHRPPDHEHRSRPWRNRPRRRLGGGGSTLPVLCSVWRQPHSRDSHRGMGRRGRHRRNGRDTNAGRRATVVRRHRRRSQGKGEIGAGEGSRGYCSPP